MDVIEEWAKIYEACPGWGPGGRNNAGIIRVKFDSMRKEVETKEAKLGEE